METEQGLLAVRGENLHIKQLNLEVGELAIEGFNYWVGLFRNKQLRDRCKNLCQTVQISACMGRSTGAGYLCCGTT